MRFFMSWNIHTQDEIKHATSLDILVHDAINLLYYKDWIDKWKHVHVCQNTLWWRFYKKSYTNNLKFSLHYHYFAIITTERRQLKSRIKTERSKPFTNVQVNCWHERKIHINDVICDRLKNRMKQLKDKVLVSITSMVFHLVERIH